MIKKVLIGIGGLFGLLIILSVIGAVAGGAEIRTSSPGTGNAA
ncbi:MAG: hypothetical protein Q8O86_01985 [Dehalococcoidia bacterium]|nr:hypothetical protein [Dehalococcoidia bacterium]